MVLSIFNLFGQKDIKEVLMQLVMVKAGQTTLFIILGLLILLGVLLYSFSVLKEKPAETAKKQSVVTAEDQPIKVFVDSCVEQTAKLALFFFGFIGGGLEPPVYEHFFVYNPNYKIPYLYGEGKTQYLTGDFVENTLGRYMDTKLRKCTGGFSAFPGTHISDESPKTKVQLLENEVVFTVAYLVTVERDGKKSQLGPEFSTRIPVRLKEMTETTNHIIEQKQQDQSLIHWDYLTEVSHKNFNVTAYTEVNATIVYRIVDEKHEVTGEPYIFQFAVKIG